MDIVNEYLQRCEAHRQRRAGYRGPAPPVVCRDGFSISIQAGEFPYSEPRSNTGPWQSVECGFPNQVDLALMPYAETEDDPLHTVYAYVPVSVVAAVLEAHGGIDYDAIALGLLTQPKRNQ